MLCGVVSTCAFAGHVTVPGLARLLCCCGFSMLMLGQCQSVDPLQLKCLSIWHLEARQQLLTSSEAHLLMQMLFDCCWRQQSRHGLSMCTLLCLSGIGMQQRQIEPATEGQGAVKLYRGRSCMCVPCGAAGAAVHSVIVGNSTSELRHMTHC